MNTIPTRHTLTRDHADYLVSAATFRDYLTGRLWRQTTEEQRVQIGIELYRTESLVPEEALQAALTEAPLMDPEWSLASNMVSWLREQNITN